MTENFAKMQIVRGHVAPSVTHSVDGKFYVDLLQESILDSTSRFPDLANYR